MADSSFSQNYRAKLFPGFVSQLEKTDPQFMARFNNFAYDEVINAPLAEGQKELDEKTRFMAILSVLLGLQGIDEFHLMLPAALKMDVTPIEAREIVYQATAYLGMGRVFPFLKVMNAIFDMSGVMLPLEDQETTTEENRLAKGNQIQIDFFGEQLRENWKNGPQDRALINKWLADNCFGDYYTRDGLTASQREMITFCFIYAQGGCEPQLKAHALANMKLGNDKPFLYQIVSQCVPYVGYPRSLNALAVVDEAAIIFAKSE